MHYSYSVRQFEAAIQEIVQSQHKDGNIGRDVSHTAAWWIPSCIPCCCWPKVQFPNIGSDVLSVARSELKTSRLLLSYHVAAHVSRIRTGARLWLQIRDAKRLLLIPG